MPNLIAVPVYNEETSIAAVLAEVRKYSDDPILVVDDGSTDASAAIADAVERVEMLRHERNEGYGKSLIDAFDYAKRRGFDTIVTLDCDEQHDPTLIPRFVELVAKTDIVSGTRYAPDSIAHGEAPAGRRAINEEITRAINEVTGYGLTDAFCGFKAYRTSALALLQLTEWGYAMPLQLWIQAARAGLRVVELAVPRVYHDSDRSFGRDLDFADRRLAYYRRVIDEEVHQSA